MTIFGTVRVWDDVEGVGVVDSAGTPGGCWVLYSEIDRRFEPTLVVGQEVEFEATPVPQDGFGWRAVKVIPRGVEPLENPRVMEIGGNSYSSELRLGFDGDPTSG